MMIETGWATDSRYAIRFAHWYDGAEWVRASLTLDGCFVVGGTGTTVLDALTHLTMALDEMRDEFAPAQPSPVAPQRPYSLYAPVSPCS